MRRAWRRCAGIPPATAWTGLQTGRATVGRMEGCIMEKTIIEAIQTAALQLTNAPRKQGFSLDPKHGGAIHYYTAPDGSITFARLRLKHPDTGEKWMRPMRRDDAGIWCELKAPELKGGTPLYNLHQKRVRNHY